MNTKLLLTLALGAMTLFADPTLKGTLGLSIDQARRVDGIQSEYRPRFATKRQEHNRELRRLRRARIANDSREIAELEKVTEALHAELRQIRASEDEEIRKILNAEQRQKFEEYRKLRKEMVGSSRDDSNRE